MRNTDEIECFNENDEVSFKKELYRGNDSFIGSALENQLKSIGRIDENQRLSLTSHDSQKLHRYFKTFAYNRGNYVQRKKRERRQERSSKYPVITIQEPPENKF
jgi:hypothetical protein